MEEDQITSVRLTAIETRLAAIEGRLSALESTGTARQPRRRKELSLEEKQQIRARLVAGQEKARARREAEAAKNKKEEA